MLSTVMLRALSAAVLTIACSAVAAQNADTAARTPPPQSDVEIFTKLRDSWGLPAGRGSCDDNPHEISFSPDGREMRKTFLKPIDENGTLIARYEIQQRGKTSMRLRRLEPSEHRQTRSGMPFLWTLTLLRSGNYQWHRADRSEGMESSVFVRCKRAKKPHDRL